ncbi:hypothetical protein A3A14_01300 [Candidatus Daviesbacteria bacterium RIFCSPLOWO2_01_FULL_43_38]|uniref:DUF1648 domain-containing protein n=1 Tax=Candidatus Daviesbacteria bacterium RIFCSPHIGHO2_12_FULL_43_11 TaxID=1797780 RepID=A0A1F5K7D9_9BACT|nr:MAG: hypothetical protein A2874_02985 [Candidatus Daviesbacteria bacterium RIFCSPHIGHO2_01_FULL_43_17]OGE36867.1 MAG: hypothetical protein A3E45_03425 [Candidatus Daviesbacteria bacterium RIFCSPHIGHO2_12_FULL_43_11]OGE63293.1 MAG: hypothetical protein A3A14_01300 [Candidatus Daviesbacteria bacterium RIFCSPLOWO2_01_FULL_43_38]OGE70059.1 MAG: hypothetical protein A3J21_00895 [Candidatus Daviesbacteria bacterium RIFCSPLOWO2_02_FULL_43_11]
MEKIISLWNQSDRFILIPAVASTASAVVITAFFFLVQNRLPSKLPLFYSLPWGQAQLSDKHQFLLLPVILILTTLVNILLALQLHPVQMVLRRILTVSLLLTNSVIIITAFKILSIFI